MRDRVVLPCILGFRLTGFRPVFKVDISLNLGPGPYVVLGGNGLGKTTLMQSIVYGLAGGLTEDIEETKSLRWDHGYFRGRLTPKQVSSSCVEVDFALGIERFSVRRGFQGPMVIGFRHGGDSWQTEARAAQDMYEQCLQTYGAYQSADDFRFIVHRLLYLPESRRLIAWDTEAQARVLMLLNQDLITERDFRLRRANIKRLDSRKRHVHVALGKAEQEMQSLMEYEKESADEEPSEDITGQTRPVPIRKAELARYVEDLTRAARQATAADRAAADVQGDLDGVSREIEALRERTELVEATLIGGFLAEEEREKCLAVHKLLQNGICPVCGTQSPELRGVAQEYAEHSQCVLCGSDQPHETNPDLDTLRSQLRDKLRAQHWLEEEYVHKSAELAGFRRKQEVLQQSVNELRFSQPVVTLAERSLPQMTQADLSDLRDQLESQEADLEAQLQTDQAGLEAEYEEFRLALQDRINDLHRSYEDYASAFLGLPCSLQEELHGRPFGLVRLVPCFNGTTRSSPESCSEAQRFFLDIAYRMALIDWATGQSTPGATFLCETPETALDMSYVDNVVSMFAQFAKRGHSLILTANIQPFGVAEKMLQTLDRSERADHVLNLLQIGQLTHVHETSLPALTEAVEKALSGR